MHMYLIGFFFFLEPSINLGLKKKKNSADAAKTS